MGIKVIMEDTTEHFQSLKEILENIHNPDQLNSHLWMESLIVQDALDSAPDLAQLSPRQQLVMAIAGLFSQMMPSMPPKQGTRLDPRWGEFGILAALYFAPLNFGTPFPPTMRDAWGRIDESILLFVYEKSGATLTDQQVAQYQLVGDELEEGPASTMSDWNRRGIQRLLDIILARERFLESDLGITSPILHPSLDDDIEKDPAQPIPSDSIEENEEGKESKKTRLTQGRKLMIYLLIPLLLIVALALVWGGIKARRVYVLGENLRQDIAQARSLLGNSPMLDTIESAGPLLESVGNDLDALDDELEGVWGVINKLGWVPVYGGDLTAAQTLMDMAQHLVGSAEETYQAVQPIIRFVDKGGQIFPPSNITTPLIVAQPQFSDAREEFELALDLRSEIDTQQLSPEIRSLLVDQLDPLVALMDDGLSVALSLPKLLGATHEGPKTYLLLAQNEDELRPTGGFITAVGNLVVQDGKILSLDFKDSGEVDATNTAYPMAPWQLQEYMNSGILVLRDSNWFTDFPTTAIWAEYLNAYTAAHSVDGVIAFDQQMLAMLLEEIGPLDVGGAPWPITSDNVVVYLRAAKIPFPEGLRLPGEGKKESVNKITKAIFERLLMGEGVELEALTKIFLRILDERHLLLQFDDELISNVISRHNWDGAVRPGEGDFLMVVDSNIGFNKVNTSIERNMAYDVNLTDLENMTSSLSVFHKNTVTGEFPCIMGWTRFNLEQDYPIDGCYWNYLRVYISEEGSLTDIGFPPVVPNARMVLNRSVPEPRVDLLDEEIEGVKGFGLLMVVPTTESAATSFSFTLPSGAVVVDPDTGQMIYHLKIQKQPGTLADPITVRIHLPERAVLESVYPKATVQKNNVLFELDIRTDLEIEVVFSIP